MDAEYEVIRQFPLENSAAVLLYALLNILSMTAPRWFFLRADDL
jgi:hypothetical protein